MRHFVCAALLAAAPCAAGAQDRTVPVPPNVVVDGVPPIPQGIADAMAKYAGFRYANLIDWSPSARGMLIWTPTDKGLQFQFLDGPRHAGAPLAPFPTGTRQVALFNPVDPKTFVFVRDPSASRRAVAEESAPSSEPGLSEDFPPSLVLITADRTTMNRTATTARKMIR